MMKKISKLLQSKFGPIYGRTWCILALCFANFVLAYGIAIYYNQGKSPVLMVISAILTIALAAVLSVPNLEPEDG